MIVTLLCDPFRVGIDIDSNPVALPPAIKFVRCADAFYEPTSLYNKPVSR